MAELVTMRVQFTYEGKYVPPQHRNENRTRFRDETLVQIRQVDEDDAPVAIDLDNIGQHGETISMRWDGESLYRPMLSHQGLQVDLDTFKRMCTGQVDIPKDQAWIDYPFPREVTSYGKGPSRYENPFKTHTVDEAKGRFHVTDKRADAEILAIRSATSVLVVGDIVHVRRREPCWRLDVGGRDSTLALKRDPIDRAKDTALTIYGRLDRGNAVIRLAEEAGCEFKAPTGCNHPDSVRIHMPEVLKFDDRKANADILFGQVNLNIGENLHKLVNTGTVRHWADFMDVATRYDAGDLAAIDDGYAILARMAETGFENRQDTYKAVSARAVATRLAIHGIMPELGSVPDFAYTGEDDADAISSISFG